MAKALAAAAVSVGAGMILAGTLALLFLLRYEEGVYSFFGLLDVGTEAAGMNSSWLFAVGAGVTTFGVAWRFLLTGAGGMTLLRLTAFHALVPFPLVPVVVLAVGLHPPRAVETKEEADRAWSAVKARLAEGLLEEFADRLFVDHPHRGKKQPGSTYSLSIRWTKKRHQIDLPRDEGEVLLTVTMELTIKPAKKEGDAAVALEVATRAADVALSLGRGPDGDWSVRGWEIRP